MTPKITLYGYWRSGTSYRTRIALALKGVAYDQICLDLRHNEHQSASYTSKNPQALVPALQVGARVLVQSPAILEWLEETYPTPPLLPADSEDRAWVRALAAVVGCDTHPLNNLRVLKYLKKPLGQDQEAVDAWIAHWITESFQALEVMISRRGGLFAFGDQPTLADCYIVPQVYAARRFNVPVEAYPTLIKAADHAMTQPAFEAAHPDNQPDAD
jgi:maleylpyruvate isomerase